MDTLRIPSGSTYPSESRDETLTVIGFDEGLERYVIERENGDRFTIEHEILLLGMGRPGAKYPNT